MKFGIGRDDKVIAKFEKELHRDYILYLLEEKFGEPGRTTFYDVDLSDLSEFVEEK